jgi:hypothetical protein
MTIIATSNISQSGNIISYTETATTEIETPKTITVAKFTTDFNNKLAEFQFHTDEVTRIDAALLISGLAPRTIELLTIQKTQSQSLLDLYYIEWVGIYNPINIVLQIL